MGLSCNCCMSRCAGDAGLLLMYTVSGKHIGYVASSVKTFFPGRVNHKQNGVFIGSKPKRLCNYD